MSRFLRLAALLLACLSAAQSAAALPSANEFSVDFPFEGGAMLMVTRDYRVSRYIRVGIMAGGGQIRRRPEIDLPDGRETDIEIRSDVFPFVGPRVTFATPVVGLSLGFAAFHAKSRTEIDWPGQGRLTGSVSGWGTGFHAPFLELEFAHSKRDLVFGIGLGGFFSTSFKDLEASGAPGRVVTDASPINTLTGRLKLVWGFGRVRARPEVDDGL